MPDVLLTMTNTPVEAWQGLIGALGGGLLTFIGVSLTNKANQKSLRHQLEHQDRQHRQRLNRERLEELYSLVSKWGNVLSRCQTIISDKLQGELGGEDVLEALQELSYGIDYIRLEMIASIYGGDIQSSLDVVWEVRNRMGTVAKAGLGDDVSDSEKKELIISISKLESEFKSAIKELKAEIARAAKEA